MNQTLKVLVVDDEPGMRLGVERVLRSYVAEYTDLRLQVGFEAVLAASGEEALAQIQTQVPDLLLLDYRLPQMSGLELQEQLASRGLEVLTVMVSAYGSLETVITATKRGAFDFLVKPFTPDELRLTLDKAAHHLLVSRQALQLAQERRRIRFEFIRVLGHELKAPLAAVEGYLRLFGKRALGNELVAYDRVVERSLVRLEGMRKLISDLLDLTRIEAGTKQRSLMALDVVEVVGAAVETAAPEAERQQVTIGLEVPPTVAMTADRGELEIILNNLLSNAIKYNRAGGSVIVRVRDAEPCVEIEVADTGIGMAPDDVDRLFEEFVRIKTPATAGILGSGLGLSIVKKLVTLAGGTVAVQSAPGTGSTFTARLPKQPPAAAPDPDGRDVA